MDALEGALQSLDSISIDPDAKEKMAKGFRMQRDATLTYLERTYGVKTVASVGVQADPKSHNVVSAIPSDQPKGVILYVIEVGYTRNDPLIREAKVVVAKGE